MTRTSRILLCGLVVAGLPSVVAAYVFLQGSPRWPAGSIVMDLQLGPSSRALDDGSVSWGESAERALSEWNPHLGDREFRVRRDSSVPIGDGNGFNNVFFSNLVFGRQFGSETLAVTTTWVRGPARAEGDVIFNNRWPWNSYRGPLREASNGTTLYDFRRIALHEFGHVLGLDHPDRAGQLVHAIMLSQTSDDDALMPDDIAGVRALYAPSAPTPNPTTPLIVNFPPRNEALTFRQALEVTYRDGLQRASVASFVDMEGAIVWTQEYLRYRVNQCTHAEAVSRVMLQIDGLGIQPVCGIPTGTAVNFPPRNEPFDFRAQLEAKYRDGLRRSSQSTFVDAEGDIVWTQEYLRYRVNRCTHQQAVERVLTQIGGGGVAPVCP